MNLEVVDRIPSLEEYKRFRTLVGWKPLSDEAAKGGLDGSLFAVCALIDGELAGFGRVVGDGHIYFYVQDVVVDPKFQGKGVGAKLMDRIMEKLKARLSSGSFVGLMAAKNVSGFYEKYGFAKRPADRPGMGLYWAPERTST